MKKPALICFKLILFYSFSFSQNRITAIYNPASQKNILWQSISVQDVPGTGKYSFLKFQDAQYDVPNHFFPVYSERIALPANAVSAEVKISNAVYKPVSDSEKTAINSYDFQQRNFVSGTIIPSVTMGMMKKKQYAYVQFIPIRKNATGTYEKLVSFSLDVNPVIDRNKSFSKVEKNYAPNSVLATGDWHKISVTADGIYKMDYFFLKNLGLDLDSVNTSDFRIDRKSTRLNSSHIPLSRMPSSA